MQLAQIADCTVPD